MPAFPPRSSIRAAATRGVRAMIALYGSDIKLDNVDGLGCYTAPRRTDQLAPDGGGYKTEITATLRLLKRDWPAYRTAADFFKKEVHIKQDDNTWQRFRIADQGVMDIHLSGEWKLELEALT